MGLQKEIDLKDIQKEDIVFWSSGNYPTQKLYGLSDLEVLANLKALYLLSTKVLGSSSFYLESDITRKATDELWLLFEQGDILYFIDDNLENYSQHGARKMEKSPTGLIVYSNKAIVQERAKKLDSIGYILRRPSYSISDQIVELWIKDIYSHDTGTMGEFLLRTVKDENERSIIITKLISLAESRDKDFVWEYLHPKLRLLRLPRGFLIIVRKRLSQIYSAVTLKLLNASIDKPEHTMSFHYITPHSRFDTSLFLGCMEILGVKRCFYDDSFDSIKLMKLKTSPEFVWFREFYFKLIELVAYQHGDTYKWLSIYREAAYKYPKSGVTGDEFLQTFRALSGSISKSSKEYSSPLEVLLNIYDLFNRLTIEDFIGKMNLISKGQVIDDTYTKETNSIIYGARLKTEEPRMIKILFLGANPLNTTKLRLDQEIREIGQALQRANFGDKFDIKQQWAVRVKDLQDHLLHHQPHIVHFSGHGSDSNEIILEDNSGNSYAVPMQALSHLFSVLKDNIRCVVLNACYSEPQARAIAEQIDCVIGISEEINDAAAISFATAFYQALGYGRDVQTAFDSGSVQIELEGLKDQDKPRLLASKGVDPRSIIFVS